MSAVTFRAKPSEVQAWVFDAKKGWLGAKDLIAWCGGVGSRNTYSGRENETRYWIITVPTPRGQTLAKPGDVIVKNERGEFTVHSLDFLEDYDKVA